MIQTHLLSVRTPKVKEVAGHTDRKRPGCEVTAVPCCLRALAWLPEGALAYQGSRAETWTQGRLTGSSCGSQAS